MPEAASHEHGNRFIEMSLAWTPVYVFVCVELENPFIIQGLDLIFFLNSKHCEKYVGAAAR